MKNRKRRLVYEITGKQIAAIMLVATFALTFVFFVGVYIGKNRAINTDLNEQNSATTNIVSKPKQIPTEQTDNGQKVSNETDIKKPEIFTSPAKSDKNTEQQNKLFTDANKNIKPDQKTSQEATKNQVKDEPKKTEITDDKLKWTVKIGTFTAYGNAKRLFDSLEASGYDPRLKSESGQQGTVYHVTVGEFDNADKAKIYGNSMREKLEYVNDYVIREIR